MTRFIRAASAAAILTSGLCSLGCVTGGSGKTHGDSYRNAVDPCYPERYNHAARQAVIAPFAQQVHNGNVLNQTLFTYHFEDGSDKLTSAGKAKLDSIARARPVDSKLYIQAATDIAVTDANAGKIVELRSEMDAKRGAAIQQYLATVPTYGPVNYEIHVHNPATPGINAEFAVGAYRGSAQGYSGGIGGGGAGAGSLSTGGGSSNLTAPAAAGGTTGSGYAAPAGSGAPR